MTRPRLVLVPSDDEARVRVSIPARPDVEAISVPVEGLPVLLGAWGVEHGAVTFQVDRLSAASAAAPAAGPAEGSSSLLSAGPPIRMVTVRLSTLLFVAGVALASMAAVDRFAWLAWPAAACLAGWACTTGLVVHDDDDVESVSRFARSRRALHSAARGHR